MLSTGRCDARSDNNRLTDLSPGPGIWGARKLLVSLVQPGFRLMDLQLAAVFFLAGAVVGYAIRAFISARRRAKARKTRWP